MISILRTRSSWFVYLLVVAYLAAAGGSAHGLALCLGSDHLAIELPHADNTDCDVPCPAAAQQRQPRETITGESAADSCVCTDILLSEGEHTSLQPRQDTSLVETPQIPASPFESCPAGCLDPSPRVLAASGHARPVVSSLLLCLKTVILIA